MIFFSRYKNDYTRSNMYSYLKSMYIKITIPIEIIAKNIRKTRIGKQEREMKYIT